MRLEKLLIHPAGEPPEAEGPASNRRSADAEGGIAAATTSERVAAIKAAPSSKRPQTIGGFNVSSMVVQIENVGAKSKPSIDKFEPSRTPISSIVSSI